MQFKNSQNSYAKYVKTGLKKTSKHQYRIVILLFIIAVIVLISPLSDISKLAPNVAVSSELPTETVKNPPDIKEKTVNQPSNKRSLIPAIDVLVKVKAKFPDSRPIEISEPEKPAPETADPETPQNKPEINTLSEPIKETTSNQHTLEMPSIHHNDERYLYDQAIPHFNQGFKYFNNEQFQLAITEFKQAIQIKPDYQSAKNALARAYKRVEKGNDENGRR